jgi:rhodanese-related sulfurtransferase
VDKVEGLIVEPIAYNIKIWDQTESGFDRDFQATADEFGDKLSALIDDQTPNVIILYCRTGGRSGFAGQLILNGEYTYGGETYTSDTFPNGYSGEVYEIDDPSGANGRGGFSGSDYSFVFNGYAGFPGRLTNSQEVPSASWKDAGLPVIRKSKQMPE